MFKEIHAEDYNVSQTTQYNNNSTKTNQTFTVTWNTTDLPNSREDTEKVVCSWCGEGWVGKHQLRRGVDAMMYERPSDEKLAAQW